VRFLLIVALLAPVAAFAQQSSPSPEVQSAVNAWFHQAAEREIMANAEVIRLRAELAKLQAAKAPEEK
jgi:hypothetical protein